MWYSYSQPNTPNNSMKTHFLKHRHDRRREKRYVVVIHMQPNTSNNSMKTNLLKHRQHDRRRDIIGGEKRDMWWLVVA